MNFGRSDEQQQLFNTFADFASAQLNQDVAARCRDGIFDRKLWQLCATRGVQGLCIPKAYGGMGLNALDTIIALEGLGYGCEDGGLTFAIGAQLLSCSIPLWQHGSEAQKDDLLRGLCSGELIATNAMTEAQGGSDAFAMHSFAAREGDDGYRLSGTKSYCANAPVADVCLAYVTTDRAKGFTGGTSAFLLRQDEHAFNVSASIEKLGLKTCQTGQITLDGISAQATTLLGRPGAGGVIFSQSMDWERTGLAALHVGTMTRLLENALAFARERKSGNLPLSKHQAISHVLADVSTQLESARLMVYRAASMLNNRRSPNREAAEAKLITSELFKSMTVKLLQIHAQQGYSTDSDIGRAQQDALASTLYSGTSEIQRNIIAAWMGC